MTARGTVDRGRAGAVPAVTGGLDRGALLRLRLDSTRMDRLDRLGWVAGMAFRIHGVRVGIRVNRTDVLERLSPYLPPRRTPASTLVVDRLYSLVVGAGRPGAAGRRFSLLYGDLTRLVRTMDPARVLERLADDLERVIPHLSGRRVLVQAGVVGWRARAILMPGPSLAGKSTLVAALLRAGATYYSDEVAALDRRGYVHPVAGPLAIREGGAEGPVTRYPVEALGGRAGTRPLPVGLIVLTAFRPGARWRPRRLSPGAVMLALLQHTLPVRHRPGRVLAALRQAVTGTLVLQGPRPEARSVVSAILEAAEAAGSGTRQRGDVGSARDGRARRIG